MNTSDVTKTGWHQVLCTYMPQQFSCCSLQLKYFVKQKDLSTKSLWRMRKPEIISLVLAISIGRDGLPRNITSATSLVSKQLVMIALKSYE